MDKQSIFDAQQFDEKRFTKIDMIKNRKSSVFLLNFLPGQHMKSHSHPYRELYLHVLEGSGTLFVDEEKVSVTKGDVLYFNPDEQVGFTNTSDKNVSIYGTLTKIYSKT